MINIILASASPRRQELLSQIGYSFTVIPSNKEEKTKETNPDEMVKLLSQGKAEEVFLGLAAQSDTLVIGADTLVVFDNQVMGKPRDIPQAEEMLSRLQGNTHQVYTGVTLVWRKQNKEMMRKSFSEKTNVTVYPMTQKEIKEYVATGEPMDKAGAYGIQGRFAAFIQGIEGDYNNVVGLPTGRLYQEIKWIEGSLQTE